MATRTPATGRVAHVSHPILLDEMFSGIIAEQLRAKGHDAQAVVTDPAFVSLPDDQVLTRATAAGRALVTTNIKDFIPLDAQYRTYTTAITSALAALLDKPGQIQDGHVLFLTRH
jgi:Domain of unknown function (DUF5615)